MYGHDRQEGCFPVCDEGKGTAAGELSLTENLILYLDKLHTTELGEARIKRNLNLNVEDVVRWCRGQIQKSGNSIVRKGKNWYVYADDCVITVNAYSYTIITAHKAKGRIDKDTKMSRNRD